MVACRQLIGMGQSVPWNGPTPPTILAPHALRTLYTSNTFAGVINCWTGTRRLSDRRRSATSSQRTVPLMAISGEIVAAHLASPDELRGIALTEAVVAYLGGNTGC